jgi:hypothetical protein
VDLGYRDMPFPFAEIATPDFEIRLEWTLDDLLAYLRTWSATQRYIKERGTIPVSNWPTPARCLAGRRRQGKTIIWPIALRCGRIE